MWTVTVAGTPISKGSMDCLGAVNGRRHMVVDSKRVQLKPWEAAISRAGQKILAEAGGPLVGAVDVELLFVMARGSTVKRELPAVYPDIDKMIRACCDGLTQSGLWRDDGQVCDVTARKRYVSTEHPEPGVTITVGQHEALL